MPYFPFAGVLFLQQLQMDRNDTILGCGGATCTTYQSRLPRSILNTRKVTMLLVLVPNYHIQEFKVIFGRTARVLNHPWFIMLIMVALENQTDILITFGNIFIFNLLFLFSITVNSWDRNKMMNGNGQSCFLNIKQSHKTFYSSRWHGPIVGIISTSKKCFHPRNQNPFLTLTPICPTSGTKWRNDWRLQQHVWSGW